MAAVKLTTLTLVLACAWSASGEQVNASCSSARSAYRSRGLPERDLPHVSGSHRLRFCGTGSEEQEREQATCCTETAEGKLYESSRQQYDAVVRNATAPVANAFGSRAKKFDEFFRELLDNSKRDFHDMFKRTYGILYEQNSEVFTDLFRDLEDYYSKGNIDLERAMDHFFAALYERMFSVLNAQFRFDDKYLACVNAHMKDLKPFGDVPKKLSVQVKRSFVATRTFAQALNVGRDVVAKMQSLDAGSDCARAVVRMSACPVCRGLGDLRPCTAYCVNVFKGCLAHHAELGAEWDNFIDALLKVADRLLGPFNIELVVDPIDIKISDAIMNFQENGYEISQKVFKGCGQPRLGKRSAAELSFESVKFERGPSAAGAGGGRGGGANVRPTTAAGTSLDRLVRDIKQKVKASRGHWAKLPHGVCAHAGYAAGASENDCWNGKERARYSNALVGDGVAAQAANPEVAVDSGRPNTVVNEQIFNLRLITNKLENAYNGMDVEWDDAVADAGSGSGSGSGDGVDSAEEDDDEDRVRSQRPVQHGNNSNRGNHGTNYGTGSGRPSNTKPGSHDAGPGRKGSSPAHEADTKLSEDDGIEFAPAATTGRPDAETTASSATPADSTQQPLSATRALTRYLVPIVVMWIGNMF